VKRALRRSNTNRSLKEGSEGGSPRPVFINHDPDITKTNQEFNE